MLKRLAIFLFGIAITQAPMPIPGQTSNPKTHTIDGEKENTKKPQNPSTQTPSGSPKQDHGPTFNANADKKTDKDKWDKAGVISNYLLVVVGIGGVIVAVCTVRKIEQQIGAAEKDTRAGIDIERPWIVVSVESPSPNL